MEAYVDENGVVQGDLKLPISVEAYITWQMAQPHKLLPQMTVGDTYARDGITDPLNDPQIRLRAKDALETLSRRKIVNPTITFPWEQ
jgi:hypothetical protein